MSSPSISALDVPNPALSRNDERQMAQ